MDKHSEINYEEIKENLEYEQIINKVIDNCFQNEGMDRLKLYKYEFEDILGDIIISIPKVEEQAIEYGHSFERELSYMVVHGFYHLIGYDHMNEEEKKDMRKKEDEILNNLRNNKRESIK